MLYFTMITVSLFLQSTKELALQESENYSTY